MVCVTVPSRPEQSVLAHRGEERSVPRSRRAALALIGAWAMLASQPALAGERDLSRDASPKQQGFEEYEAALAAVLPIAGWPSRITFGDSLVRVLSAGVLDREKYLALAGGPEAVPAPMLSLLDRTSTDAILVTRESAAQLVDLLWPIGLANRVAANQTSPIAGPDIESFASTGGWTLGRAPTGGQYFNAYAIVDLTPAQEARAVRVARTTFRPCCDNSTFFQDCNHGSALFAILQLGAAQGLDEAALYQEALAFNSFWFPDTYVATALFFRLVRGVEWGDVDPKLVMGHDFSTASGWTQNVAQPLAAFPDLFPPPSNSVNCGA